MSDFSEDTAKQEWVRRRIDAVESVYTAYDALIENGIDIPDRNVDFQISCAFHGADKKPSARYYGSAGRPHYHCFQCKVHENGIGLLARFQGIKFMQALSDLERRFGIKVPKRPDAPDIEEPKEKGANYQSEAWNDIPRVLALLEAKLLRIRDKVSLIDYVKFCKVLDIIRWDFEHNGRESTPPMIEALTALRVKMNGKPPPSVLL